jgi:hypothetical protein
MSKAAALSGRLAVMLDKENELQEANARVAELTRALQESNESLPPTVGHSQGGVSGRVSAEMELSKPRRKLALYKAKKPCGTSLFDPCGTDVTVKEAFPVVFPLVDDGDKCLLVHALWKAAGEPRDGTRGWCAAAEVGPGEAWTVENLQGLEFQTLVDLQAVAGPSYRRSAPMALQLISLEQGSTVGDDLKFRPNKHLQPLKEYIWCDDEMATVGNMKNLRLCLNVSAFAAPSDYNSETNYENLKSHLFDQAECSEGVLTLLSSPLSTVNLDDTARQMAGVVMKGVE